MTFLLILMLLGFNGLFAQDQELESRDTLSSEEIKWVGVWKVDLPEQKDNLDTETKAQVDQMEGKQQEDFWRAAESIVFALDNEKNFVMAWVAEGAHNEVRGKWRLDSKTGILSFSSDTEVVEYRIEFTGKGQVWIPIRGPKRGFNKFHIIGLGK